MRSTRFAPLPVVCLALVLTGCGPQWSARDSGSVRLIEHRNGPTLGTDTTSGVGLLTAGGLAFKDLNRNGTLDAYEDWRLGAEERAADLASRMTIEQIAGLMLYSSHQAIPAATGRFTSATYGGKPYAESGAAPSDLTDDQRRFLTEDGVRHVLITTVESPEVAAVWNNNAQALVEGTGLGIPINISSDPRHETRAEQEYNAGSGADISMWPPSIGMAATFDPALVQTFGEIASKEYRALGIATALSPQVDLATDPRWGRFSGTFGEHPQMATDMARAYVSGFQTSTGEAEISGGWGYESVNAMVKHWPGGGTGEGGRDAHYGFGKYAVYPGGQFDLHMKPFLEGAFRLDGGTGMAAAVMPYYTISTGQDTTYGENVGNSYSRYVITDLLRDRFGYTGVVCTDWGVTRDHQAMDRFGSAPWGVETLSVGEKHYKALSAGVDQFGGNNDVGPVLEAYRMGVADHGEAAMRARFETSAVRLLLNVFRTGLFENPYLDPEATKATVGNPDFMAAGYEAQLKSVVLLKNEGAALPLAAGTRVWVPQRHVPEQRTFFGVRPASVVDPLSPAVVGRYFEAVDGPSEADVAIVVIRSPELGTGAGYSRADAEAGGNGYMPASLQYGPYTADGARDPSLGGGDPLETFTNRTYRGKSTTTANATDLQAVLDARAAMGDKPVIVVLQATNPAVVAEFEASASALVVTFGVQDQALLDILAGAVEPSGLLPLQMPATMQTVETQFEDVPLDMEPHVDSAGNAYDFGFGLNWAGVISDERNTKYHR